MLRDLQATPVFVIQHERVGGDAVLASTLFCLYMAALRDTALFKEDFDSGLFWVFFSKLVSLYLSVHGAFLDFNIALSSQ